MVTAIYLDKWNSLGSEEQSVLVQEVVDKLENPVWDSAQDALENDIACLTGNGDCPSGESRSMTPVSPSDSDFEKARSVLISDVLPDWGERAGPEWVKRRNDSVGKVIGVEIR